MGKYRVLKVDLVHEPTGKVICEKSFVVTSQADIDAFILHALHHKWLFLITIGHNCGIENITEIITHKNHHKFYMDIPEFYSELAAPTKESLKIAKSYPSAYIMKDWLAEIDNMIKEQEKSA